MQDAMINEARRCYQANTESNHETSWQFPLRRKFRFACYQVQCSVLSIK